ncbi:MAG: four helix bundle protein [Candidatus Saccharimonas sp.]|nr:four helix bundle protein [Planctomycetaceae bacterium]
MFGFEKLEVWQLAIDYSDDIYATTRLFPNDERFGLTNQIRRASVSISSNIAEGSGRSSRKDFARFVEIAFGSLLETVSQFTIAKRQGFIEQPDFDRLYAAAERLGRMLSGLKNSLES